MRSKPSAANLRSPLDKSRRHPRRDTGPRARGGLMMLLALACFGAVSFLWMDWATIDQTLTGEGRVIKTAPAVKLAHATGGPIAALLVQTGDVVQEGALLMQIDPTLLRAHQEALGRDNIKQRLHYTRLVAQIEKRAFDVPPAIAQQFPEWVEDQQAQYHAAQQRVDEVTQSAVDASASVPESQLPDLQAALQEQLQAWHNGDLAQRSELERLLEDQHAVLAQLDQALAACDMRAPFAGRVQSMGTFSPGNVLRPGEVLLTLAPQEESLKVMIQMSLPQGARIIPGMTARVRVKGLDPLIYNALPGKVLDVQEIQADDIASPQVAVTIGVENDPGTASGNGQPSHSDLARAGMEIAAQVSLGQKTILSYARDALKALRQDHKPTA